MRFALMTEPQQGLSYDEILALARAAEDAGFESVLPIRPLRQLPGAAGLPTTDAWATLAGLARETTRIGLGVLVSPVTFRAPGNLAKVTATVAEMSGGRVELGLGAGWNEAEHHQHGLAFPDTRERFDMLEEQLAIVHGLWTEPDGWSYSGAHWQVSDALFRPHPPAPAGRRHPNLIIGGEAKPRMAALVARYADEINITSATPASAAAGYERVQAACRAIGRDPDSVTRSAMTGVLVGRDEAEVERRATELLASVGRDGLDADEWLAERRQRWIIGTPDQARARVAELAAAGVERLMLQTFLPRDLEMVALLGEIFLAKPPDWGGPLAGRLRTRLSSAARPRRFRRDGSRRSGISCMNSVTPTATNAAPLDAQPHRVGDGQRERLVDAVDDRLDVRLDERAGLQPAARPGCARQVAHARRESLTLRPAEVELAGELVDLRLRPRRPRS